MIETVNVKMEESSAFSFSLSGDIDIPDKNADSHDLSEEFTFTVPSINENGEVPNWAITVEAPEEPQCMCENNLSVDKNSNSDHDPDSLNSSFALEQQDSDTDCSFVFRLSDSDVHTSTDSYSCSSEDTVVMRVNDTAQIMHSLEDSVNTGQLQTNLPSQQCTLDLHQEENVYSYNLDDLNTNHSGADIVDSGYQAAEELQDQSSAGISHNSSAAMASGDVESTVTITIPFLTSSQSSENNYFPSSSEDDEPGGMFYNKHLDTLSVDSDGTKDNISDYDNISGEHDFDPNLYQITPDQYDPESEDTSESDSEASTKSDSESCSSSDDEDNALEKGAVKCNRSFGLPRPKRLCTIYEEDDSPSEHSEHTTIDASTYTLLCGNNVVSESVTDVPPVSAESDPQVCQEAVNSNLYALVF